MTKPLTAKKSKKQRTRKTKGSAKGTKMPPPPKSKTPRTRTTINKTSNVPGDTENAQKNNTTNGNGQIQPTETELTSADELEVLKLENCQMKNICDELKCKIQSLEKTHASELKKLTKNVEALEQKNCLLKKQGNLSEDIVKRNESLKKDNHELKTAIKTLEDKLAQQDELIEQVSILHREAEFTKTKLENFQSLQANYGILEEELATVNQTLEYMKQNIVTEKIHSAKERRNNLEGSDDGTYAESRNPGHSHVEEAREEKFKYAGYMRQFPQRSRNTKSPRYFHDSRKDTNQKPQFNLKKYPSFSNQCNETNSGKAFYNKTHPYKNPRK